MTISNEEQIRHYVEEGRVARAAYWAAIELDDEQELGRPAYEAQLVKLEKRLGRHLPPSYRKFLSMYDGWRIADGAVDLLSVQEMLEGPRAIRIREWQNEASKENDFVAANSLVIGESKISSSKYLLDPDRFNDNGEWALINYDHGEELVLPSFLAWLEESLIAYQELAQKEEKLIQIRTGILQKKAER